MPDDSNDAKGAPKSPLPREIVDAVRAGKCILFLGAMSSAPSPPGCRYKYETTPPSGGELSRRLAKRFGYQGDDVNNLQRVSLFAEFYERKDDNGVSREKGSRNQLIQVVAEEIKRPAGSPDPADAAAPPAADAAKAPVIEPSPALKMLAELPFRIIITTNYDRLFDRALSNARARDGNPKEPCITVYDPTRQGEPEEVPDDPDELKPILLKLHGDISKPESIVITEEDYITFVQRMADKDQHPVHQYIRTKMRAWPFLFVGYSLRDYNLRLLFRTLKWGMDSSRSPLSYSVDPYPDDLVVAVCQRGRQQPEIFFIGDDLWNFVPDLYKAVLGKDFKE
jgi:SIR2-like protein